jgi:ABC-type nitrate/sulfonate/bicarbonate transport system permease component
MKRLDLRRLAAPAAQLGVLIIVIAAWQLATGSGTNPYFLSPSAIVSFMYHQWFDGPASHLWLTSDATGNLLPSLGRMLLGLVIASLIGVAAGVAIGRVRVLAELTEPLVHFGRAIPPPVVVPFFLFLFKIGTPMEAASVAFGVVWPVLVNTIDGARHVHPGQLETARAFRIGPAQRLVRVILPAAAPKIFAGLRLGLAMALILMIVSEFQGATEGIGYEVNTAQSTLDMSVVWGAIVLLGVLGIVLNAIFAVAERRALAWQRGSARAE